MRTLEVSEMSGEAGLATKLKDEAAASQKSRPARARFSMAGVQVVRIPRRRIPNTASAHTRRP
jgi:hypothetical protein